MLSIAARDSRESVYSYAKVLLDHYNQANRGSYCCDYVHLPKGVPLIKQEGAILATFERLYFGEGLTSSIVQVLGNRSMKLKYLNPNVIFVASGPPEGQAAQATAAIEAAVTVQLIDTISGQVIYSQALEVGRDVLPHTTYMCLHSLQLLGIKSPSAGALLSQSQLQCM